MPAGAEKAVQAAKADLARRTGIDQAAIVVVRADAVDWRDSSLGCPRPGQMYIQVITPGYLVVLQAAGRTHEYHTDRDGSRVVLCQQ